MTKAEGKAAGKAASHTPGPWTYNEGRVANGDATVAVVNEEADGRLIAAAPSMLDTIKALLVTLSLYTTEQAYPLMNGVADARAILRDVEG